MVAKESKKKKKKTKKKVSSASAHLFNNLTSVKFKLKGRVYEVDIGGELLFNEEEDVHSLVERIPAIMGYFGSIVSLLEKEVRDKDAIRKQVEAELDKQVRNKGVIGEKRIENVIRRYPKWLEAQLEVSKAKEKALRASLLYDALREKSIAIMSRSSDIRNVPSDSIRGISRKEVIPLDERRREG